MKRLNQQGFTLIKVDGRSIMRAGIRGPAKGFTLVEVMVVLALVAIICSMAVPSLQGYATNTNLRTAARDIQSDFLSLKGRAISQNNAYRIAFDPGGNNYTIEQGTDGGPPYAAVQVKTPTTFGGGIGISNAAFSDGTSSITFQERGMVTNGTVVLTNSRGSTATITTTISGRTYVQLNFR